MPQEEDDLPPETNIDAEISVAVAAAPIFCSVSFNELLAEFC